MSGNNDNGMRKVAEDWNGDNLNDNDVDKIDYK